jgi:hypothetical protein
MAPMEKLDTYFANRFDAAGRAWILHKVELARLKSQLQKCYKQRMELQCKRIAEHGKIDPRDSNP